jgi:undecaprenyl-diphosphatase
MIVSMPGRAIGALALLALLVAGLAYAWRWFERDPGAVVERVEIGWLRRFAAARFARGEYLGLHLTIGLLVSLAGLALFATVTEDVVEHERLTHFDVTLFGWLQSHATPLGRAVCTWISYIGSFPAMAGLALAGGLVLALRRRWMVLGGWATAFAGGGLLDGLLKLAIRRPRPPTAAASLVHSWSFPSGHAMGSLIGYGMLAYLLVSLGVHRRGAQFAILASAAVLTVAIGISRLYLGVHYFSDVVGGYAAGVLWLSTCVSGLEVARRWRDVKPARS